MSFADLGVSRPVTDALSRRGIVAPFAVQKLVIADVLAGRDVLVQSPTGSGKTLAFGAPLADLLEPDGRKPSGPRARAHPRARHPDRRRASRHRSRPGGSQSPRSTVGLGSRSRPSARSAPTSWSRRRAGSRTCSNGVR